MSRYCDIDPQDLDPDTGRPYSNYSSASLDTSFHDGEAEGDDSGAWAAAFRIGEIVRWPNGTDGPVRGINMDDDTLLDHCGGWISAFEVDKIT